MGRRELFSLLALAPPLSRRSLQAYSSSPAPMLPHTQTRNTTRETTDQAPQRGGIWDGPGDSMMIHFTRIKAAVPVAVILAVGIPAVGILVVGILVAVILAVGIPAAGCQVTRSHHLDQVGQLPAR